MLLGIVVEHVSQLWLQLYLIQYLYLTYCVYAT